MYFYMYTYMCIYITYPCRGRPTRSSSQAGSRSPSTVSKGGHGIKTHEAHGAKAHLPTHKYPAGPSIRPICTRCCFAMTNEIQVCSNVR